MDFERQARRCINEVMQSVEDVEDFHEAANKIVKEIITRSNNSKEKGHEDAVCYYALAGLNDNQLREHVRQDLLKGRGIAQLDLSPDPKPEKQAYNTMRSMWEAQNKSDEGGKSGGRQGGNGGGQTTSEQRKYANLAGRVMVDLKNKLDKSR